MTMLEKAARAMEPTVWNPPDEFVATQLQKRYYADRRLRSLEKARAMLAAIRVDMNLMIVVGRQLALPPATVDLCWTRCIDTILAEKAE